MQNIYSPHPSTSCGAAVLRKALWESLLWDRPAGRKASSCLVPHLSSLPWLSNLEPKGANTDLWRFGFFVPAWQLLYPFLPSLCFTASAAKFRFYVTLSTSCLPTVPHNPAPGEPGPHSPHHQATTHSAMGLREAHTYLPCFYKVQLLQLSSYTLVRKFVHTVDSKACKT